MKGDRVPNTDHISRYCGGASINEDGSINGTAFRLRRLRDANWEAFLSVNWLEYLALPNRQAQIAEIRRVLGAKLKLGAKAQLAELNVGELRQYVSAESADARTLEILHEPEEPIDPSHSGIFGLEPEDDLIADLIADVVREIYPVRSSSDR